MWWYHMGSGPGRGGSNRRHSLMKIEPWPTNPSLTRGSALSERIRGCLTFIRTQMVQPGGSSIQRTSNQGHVPVSHTFITKRCLTLVVSAYKTQLYCRHEVSVSRFSLVASFFQLLLIASRWMKGPRLR